LKGRHRVINQPAARAEPRNLPLPPSLAQANRASADPNASADLTDAEWVAVQPLLADSRGRNDRRVLGGIVWKHRTGRGWRDIPGVIGNGWTTYYNRFRAWEKSGVWAEIVQAAEAAAASRTPPQQPSADFHRRDGPPAPPGRLPRRRIGEASELARADVEATELPVTVNGHRLRPKSAKARIIRAIIAVLRKEGWAPRWEIERAVRRLGIIGSSDNSSNRLPVILSKSKDLFANCRLVGVGETGWYLRETEKGGSLTQKADAK